MIIFLTFDTKEECDKFIYLYSHYLNTVYYTVTRFVSEPYTIEDLSQDVFLALSKHLDKCDLSNPTQTRANSHFLRTAGPHFPDSQGHIKRTVRGNSRAGVSRPC